MGRLAGARLVREWNRCLRLRRSIDRACGSTRYKRSRGRSACDPLRLRICHLGPTHCPASAALAAGAHACHCPARVGCPGLSRQCGHHPAGTGAAACTVRCLRRRDRHTDREPRLPACAARSTGPSVRDRGCWNDGCLRVGSADRHLDRRVPQLESELSLGGGAEHGERMRHRHGAETPLRARAEAPPRAGSTFERSGGCRSASSDSPRPSQSSPTSVRWSRRSPAGAEGASARCRP